MVTWTAEVSPYVGVIAGSVLIGLAAFFVFLQMEKEEPLLVVIALLVGVVVCAFINPGSYQVSGELEVVDARAVPVKEDEVYSFSNGAELTGSYELGETIQLLCVPSTVECVPDDGGLRNAKKLKPAILGKIADEQDSSLGVFVYVVSFERNTDTD